MPFNNAPLLQRLEKSVQGNADTLVVPVARRRVRSEPCLPERLPNSSFITREAEALAPKVLEDQLSRSKSLEISTDVTEDSNESKSDDGLQRNQAETSSEPPSPTSPRASSLFKNIVRTLSSIQHKKKSISMADVQPFEIMKAIESSDIMFLMEVRDKAFPLLLQTTGGQTPLVHAIRIGNTDVAIVLLGAFSRWVNRLEDADVVKPEVQSQLKALRVGLKLAINQGLASSQPDLIASFMQTLVMSEGDKWVWAQVSLVARALNGTADGKPVQTADLSIRKFTTKELGKASRIASVEDYIANAIADLLVMAAWSLVTQAVPQVDNIPPYYFARDDRVYKSFIERYEKHKNQILNSCPRRLRLQLKALKTGLQGRQISFRKKVELLEVKLDHEIQDAL